MSEELQPDDVLFKEIFSEPEQAEGLLRTNMPAALAMRIDFSSLELAPAALARRALKSPQNKLLFTARFADSGAQVYLLVVRRHTREPLMPVLFICDFARIWECWIEENEGARKIPLIFPLLLYHGSEPWEDPHDLHSIIDA